MRKVPIRAESTNALGVGTALTFPKARGTRGTGGGKMRISHTNVYGLARTVLALGTLGTLLLASDDTLFGSNGLSVTPYPMRDYLLFGALEEHLQWAKAIACAVLLTVISGYWPRLSALPHWWVSLSFAQGTAVPDGGDMLTSLLTLLIVPLALTDPRRNHWHGPVAVKTKAASIGNQVAWSTLHVLRAQVALVYAYSAIAKLGVPEWANGTALYYWAIDPSIGVAKSAHKWLYPVLSNPYVVMILSWSPIVFMICLALTLTMPSQSRRLFVWPAIAFHFGNMILFGLVSFFFTMTAADLLLLLPLDIPITFPSTRRLTALFRQISKGKHCETTTSG